MAAPLNEAELMSLLMASPVYQKLEQIKDAVKNGITPPKHRMEPGEYGYTEEIIRIYRIFKILYYPCKIDSHADTWYIIYSKLDLLKRCSIE